MTNLPDVIVGAIVGAVVTLPLTLLGEWLLKGGAARINRSVWKWHARDMPKGPPLVYAVREDANRRIRISNFGFDTLEVRYAVEHDREFNYTNDRRRIALPPRTLDPGDSFVVSWDEVEIPDDDFFNYKRTPYPSQMTTTFRNRGLRRRFRPVDIETPQPFTKPGLSDKPLQDSICESISIASFGRFTPEGRAQVMALSDDVARNILRRASERQGSVENPIEEHFEKARQTAAHFEKGGTS